MFGALLLSFFFFFSGFSHATSDLIGTAGQLNAQAGSRGAVANRRIADQLYQQSLTDEAQARSGLIPDFGLLSKALHESKDAKAADDQAKEFARAALMANQSGAASGDFQSQRYGGTTTEGELRDLATNNSPYESAVQSRLGGYGMKLDSDRMSLSTPFGKFPLGMSTDQMQKTMVGLANSVGLSGDSIVKGVQDAVKTRDAIAARTLAQVDAELAQKGIRNPTASTGAAGSNGGGTLGALKEGSAKGIPPKSAAEPPVLPERGESRGENSVDWEKRKRALAENQAALKRQMGLLSPETSPLHKANQDLFQVVHLKYESLKAGDHFFEN